VAVRDGFVVDERNATAVGEICQRLDGIPLAIELAAARLASMSPAEIAGLLDERFRLLTGGKRIAVERHQTLRSTIDWSYGLLGESERAVFDRLGVFVGSFDSAAAVDVAGDNELGRWDVLDALGDLAAKSMLVLETSAEDATRYQLLETLRQYAREHLEEAETTDELRRRHAAHYAAWAADAGAGLFGPDELRWRAALRADLDNLRVAVAWSLDAAEPADREYALRVIAELSFEVCNNRAAGMAPWADRALAFLDDARPELRVGVLGAAAWSAVMALDYERAHDLAALATGIAEPHGETEVNPRFWVALDAAVNVASLYTGHFDEADARMEGLVERYAAAPQREQAWINSLAGATLAMSYLLRGDSTQARERSREALERARHSGSPSAVSLAEYVYGWTTMYSDPDAALAAFDESIRLTRAGAADHSLAHSMVRAAVLRAPTDPARARADLRAALIYARDVGSHVTSMTVLDYGIRITAIAGPADAGAVMIGFVESGGSISLNPVVGDEAVARREAVECIRAGLGEDRYAAMTAQGARLSHDELTARLVDELSTTIE